MKDMQQLIMEKSKGACRFNPDEQRLFLETFEERVIVKILIGEANDCQVLEAFPKILKKVAQDYQPLFLKISPNVDTKAQIAYLKLAQDLPCCGTIVSADCQHSPYGVILHTDHPVEIVDKSLAPFLEKKVAPQTSCKPSFWSQLFKYK